MLFRFFFRVCVVFSVAAFCANALPTSFSRKLEDVRINLHPTISAAQDEGTHGVIPLRAMQRTDEEEAAYFDILDEHHDLLDQGQTYNHRKQNKTEREKEREVKETGTVTQGRVVRYQH